MSKEPWDNVLSTVQVLLARELERITAGYATLRHTELMEELRHEPGWEEACDPRLTGEAKLPPESPTRHPGQAL